MKYIKLFENYISGLENYLVYKYKLHWVAKVKRNLFASSVEQKDIEKALEEWRYTGDCVVTKDAVCELCGQPYLHYHFQIRNLLKSNELWIGSECIKRFSAEDTKSIQFFDNYGNRITDERLIIKTVNKQMVDLKKDKKVQEVLELLSDLYNKTLESTLNELFDQYSNKEYLTPIQMLWLDNYFSENNIEVNPHIFNVNLSNRFYLDQVFTRSADSIMRLEKYLTRDQKEILDYNLNRKRRLS
jgi:hypothetical protein